MPTITTGDLHAEASARGGKGLRGRDMFIGDARTADEQPALDADFFAPPGLVRLTMDLKGGFP